LTYDPDVNALYIEMLDAEVHETLELAKGVYIDVNAVERSSASKCSTPRLAHSIDPGPAQQGGAARPLNPPRPVTPPQRRDATEYGGDSR